MSNKANLLCSGAKPMELKPQAIEVSGSVNPDDLGLHGYPYRMTFGDGVPVLVIAPAKRIKKNVYKLIVIPDLGDEWGDYVD